MNLGGAGCDAVLVASRLIGRRTPVFTRIRARPGRRVSRFSARKPRCASEAVCANLQGFDSCLMIRERPSSIVEEAGGQDEAISEVLVVMGNASKMDEPSGRAKTEIRSARSTPLHRSAHVPLRKRALRTKEHIIDTAKSLFLNQGYAATTIDDIAVAAGVSRASFYTYFSSRREILIIAGHEARHESLDLMEQVRHMKLDDLPKEFEGWISRYFAFLSDHGGYLLTWQQAALQDNEFRVLGMRGSKRATNMLAESFQLLGSKHSHADLIIRSLAIRAMLDRFWYHWRITKTPLKEKAVLQNFAQMIVNMILSDDVVAAPASPATPAKRKDAVAAPAKPAKRKKSPE